MQYRIIGTTVPAVELRLNSGEQVYTQSGGMAWMSPSVSMETNTNGGFLKGIGRMFAGESFFMATYSANADDSRIAFASTVPGAIRALDVSNDDYIIQKGAFLAAEKTVELDTVFTKRLSAGIFGGEGLIMQQLSGSGLCFLEIDGDAVEKTLAPGETIMVDTGNVVAFDSEVTYEVETVKGFKNILFGGEGLFLTKLTGPGKVILQTQAIRSLAERIIPYIPRQTSSN